MLRFCCCQFIRFGSKAFFFSCWWCDCVRISGYCIDDRVYTSPVYGVFSLVLCCVHSHSPIHTTVTYSVTHTNTHIYASICIYRLVKCYSSVILDNRLDEEKKMGEFRMANFMREIQRNKSTAIFHLPPSIRRFDVGNNREGMGRTFILLPINARDEMNIVEMCKFFSFPCNLLLLFYGRQLVSNTIFFSQIRKKFIWCKKEASNQANRYNKNS